MRLLLSFRSKKCTPDVVYHTHNEMTGRDAAIAAPVYLISMVFSNRAQAYVRALCIGALVFKKYVWPLSTKWTYIVHREKIDKSLAPFFINTNQEMEFLFLTIGLSFLVCLVQ
jgi:hypothetical protein